MKLRDIIETKLGSCFLDNIEYGASEHTKKELNKDYTLNSTKENKG